MSPDLLLRVTANSGIPLAFFKCMTLDKQLISDTVLLMIEHHKLILYLFAITVEFDYVEELLTSLAKVVFCASFPFLVQV